MEITNINLGACPPQYLSIGYRDEYGARPVAFDFSAWAAEYGAGVLQLLLQRPGEKEPFPVLLDIDGTTATWTPDEVATKNEGQGRAQLLYTRDGLQVRDAVFTVLIAPSLGAAGDPPEPYEDWLERLLTIAAEAQQSALDAAGSAEAAGTSAGAAAGSAGAAAQSALDAEAAKSGAEAAEQTARQAAALARAKAAEAAEAGQIAGENADYAQQQRIMAEADAVDAHDSAESAAQSAEDAQAASSAAQTAASAAAASASAAAGSAADAASAVTDVETKGAEQITAINQAGTTQIAAVDAAGTAQVQAIEDKGEEVIASIPSDYTELADEVSDLKSALYDPRTGLAQKAGLLRDTSEGAVASFVPDASVENLLGLTVGIEPVQDLHGYDHPWPAGGGANKWGGLVMANDIATVTGGTIDQQAKTLSFDAGVEVKLTGDLQFKENTQYTYIFSGTVTGYANMMFVYTDGTNDRTFGRYFRLGANVSVQGKTVKGLYRRQYSGTTVVNYEQSGLFEGVISADQFTPYSNICPIPGWDAVSIWNKPTHDTSADPTVTIQLGQTVYGGTLDVTNGRLTVDRVGVDMGTLNWVFMNVNNVRRLCSDSLIPRPLTPRSDYYKPEIVCSIYKTVNVSQLSDNPYSISMGFSGYGYGNRLIVNDETITSSEMASEKMSGQTCVYKLLDPIEIPLDPVAVSTIAGQLNNLWADTGDVSVEFAADIKTYIDQKIAAAVAALS